MVKQVYKQWNDFEDGVWQEQMNVQDFVHRNAASNESDDFFMTL